MPEDPGDVAITVLRSAGELESCRDLWFRLCRHRDADPDFFRMIVATRPTAAPYVLLLRTPTKEALVVGRLETVRLESRFGYVQIPSPQLRILGLIPGGLLGDIDPVLARAVAVHLRGLMRHAELDAVILHHADVTNPLFTEFARIRGFSLFRQSAPTLPYWLRDIGTGMGKFADGISRNERSNQRRREKKLRAEFRDDVRIECYDSLDGLPRMIEDAERVAARSYQRGIGVGFVGTEPIRHRLAWLAEHHWLRGWVLYLGGLPAAFWIGVVREGTFFSDYLAYDSSLSPFAPGTYLTMKVLEQLQDTPSGVRLIDFGIGDAAYKERFGTEVRRTATLHVFAPTWRGLSAGTLQSAVTLATTVAKAALRRARVLDRLKRRQRAAVVSEAG